MTQATGTTLARNHTRWRGPNAVEFSKRVLDPLATHLWHQYRAQYLVAIAVLAVECLTLHLVQIKTGFPNHPLGIIAACAFTAGTSWASGLFAAQYVRWRRTDETLRLQAELDRLACSVSGRVFLQTLERNEPRICHHTVLSEALRQNPAE